MKDQQRFSLRPDIILQPGHDCALLVDLTGETIYSANGTGAFVLQLIGDRRTLSQMTTILGQEYHVTGKQLEADLEMLLNELLDRKLIVEELPRGR